MPPRSKSMHQKKEERMRQEAETLGLRFGSGLRRRGLFEVAPTLRLHLRAACFSYHPALIIYVPIAPIGSFTFNFIGALGIRGFGASGFARLVWLD